VTGPDRGGFPAWICTRVAVARAGGRARRLRPGRFPEGRPLPALDGLILGGGADVDPALYGDEERLTPAATPPRHSRLPERVLTWLLVPFLWLLRRLFALSSGGMDRARDRFETRCLREALAGGLPVLGICRGAQLMNIEAGGSLHAELSGFYGEAGNLRSVAPRKRVKLTAGTRLHALLGEEALVNSLHLQAVDRLGEAMVCAARDESGVIQAIEQTGGGYRIGVQWHPEYLPALRIQQRLFRDLVENAREAPDPRADLAPPRTARRDRRHRTGRWWVGVLLALVLLGGWGWWTLLSPSGYRPPPDLPAIEEERTHEVFVYGSLRSAMVRRIVMGRAGDPRPAVLPGYEREGRHNARPAPGGKIHGLVLTVTADELRRLDRYERLGLRYERVEAELEEGASVWLYRRL
jgi:putative glutamine amidotransferase